MDTLKFAKKLRKNQTDTENLLWSHLRAKRLEGHKFRRQRPIGGYIVDFINYEYRLIIELDGGQHNSEKIIKKDLERANFLKQRGFKIIRFWDNEVHSNLEGILEEILRSLATSPGLRPSSP